MAAIEPDWAAIVREYHQLGIHYAWQYLRMCVSVKDPIETARDAMQDAWIRLMRRGLRPGDSVKGLVIVHAISCAKDAAAKHPHVATIRERSLKRNPVRRHKRGCPCAMCNNLAVMWPVQVFGGLIGEVIYDEAIGEPGCGDE